LKISWATQCIKNHKKIEVNIYILHTCIGKCRCINLLYKLWSKHLTHSDWSILSSIKFQISISHPDWSIQICKKSWQFWRNYYTHSIRQFECVKEPKKIIQISILHIPIDQSKVLLSFVRRDGSWMLTIKPEML